MSLAMSADAYRPWREMAVKAKKMEENPSIPLWQKKPIGSQVLMRRWSLIS